MKRIGYLTTLFAFVLLFGGLIGYLFAQSTPSLVASSIFAFFFLLASLALFKDQPWGLKLALILSLILTAFFAWRSFRNPSLIPISMALLSAALSLYLALGVTKH
jgi:uncharacterized membrane protein (UPF0136 family)